MYVASWKLAEGKPTTLVTRDPFRGQRSRSPGRLMPWPKLSHILRMGRPTNFVCGWVQGPTWPSCAVT